MSLNNSSNMFYGDSNTDESRVTEWLNTAAVSVDSTEKVDLLRKVQEVVISKSPYLLKKVLDDVLGFTTDRDADVKKCLVGFIEQACKKQEDILGTVMPNLHVLLCDESVQVQKRVIQAASSVYRTLLSWIAKASQVTDFMEKAWNHFTEIKLEILNMVDSDNDGVRTHSVKFLEGVVLLQTYIDVETPRKENDFSLNDIPLTLKFARRRKLEDEANHIFSLLVKFHGSPHISSVNLMACMGALCTIAKARPAFMPRVVSALEKLNSNLPPTLSHSQVSSVRKHLKLQMINILKHPSSFDLQPTLTSVLQDLGCSPQEIARSIPKVDERRRNLKRSLDSIPLPAMKRPKIEDENMEYDEEKIEKQQSEAKTINEQFIIENLNVETATQIVIRSIQQVPNEIPDHFLNNYKPIGYVSLPNQIKQIAKLLAEQMTETGTGPGANAIDVEPPLRMKQKEDAIIKGPVKKDSSETNQEIVESKKSKLKEDDKTSKSSKQKLKPLRLEQMTRPLSPESREQMMAQTIRRILQSERVANQGGASVIRSKIITTLASTFGPIVREIVLMFILEDMKSHIDLALAWLYEEYSFMQGFNRMSSVLRRGEKPDRNYNTLLCTLIGHLESEIRDRDLFLARIFLEAPLITEEAVEVLKGISVRENRSVAVMALIQELIYRRPPKYITFLNVLLYQTAHETSIVREEALARILDIYKKNDFKNIIEEHAAVYLSFLSQPQPPPILFGTDRGRPQILDVWSDEIIRACLYLYLGLLPYNETLIHELCNIYTQTSADIKRVILRFIEQPIRGMGIESPELLTLVERCPKGSETLVTRIIHILTDRGPPSAHLVAKVRELYQTRVADVRFLIPVLNGLTKKEVIAALPKLIKLNPIVVKEVFNRLLNTSGESPITPADLLIALHTIDASKTDLKTVMKSTSLCFAEKSIYTQEVLAVVMQQLMDVTPLPTLLMRTVIQSLSLYPRLSGFVMNILQRLILKQVWKQKVVWEGFIKCCQRTKPQSFQVLLQLPPAQLAEALTSCPDLRSPLLEHVQAFTDAQRAHLSSSLMDVLMGRTVPTEIDGVVITKTEPNDSAINPTEPLPPGMD